MIVAQIQNTIHKSFVTGLLVMTFISGINTNHHLRQNKLIENNNPASQAAIQRKKGDEVFGFAPYWTLDKLQNVDFNVLTTLAYFGIPVNADGSFATSDPGYQKFESDQATALFDKAHSFGTRVSLTLTAMDNTTILALMDNTQAQAQTISNTVNTVKSRGIDGVNIDFEYIGDPGQAYRDKFSTFVKNMTDAMHSAIPSSQVTVSVYASAIKDPKIYDIASLGKTTDGIFMMAYDFATVASDSAMPTAPLYGYKDGTYWYDVSTAVDDFLTQMPANKLILGVPWYAYNYAVNSPEVKAPTLPSYSWRGKPFTQTYGLTASQITQASSNYQSGWDNEGQVGWKAYYVPSTGTWRMVFVDDVKSLSLKYDFAKSKNLQGVGIWALGFDDGTHEMWSLLENEFGTKIANNAVAVKSSNPMN